MVVGFKRGRGGGGGRGGYDDSGFQGEMDVGGNCGGFEKAEEEVVDLRKRRMRKQ